MSDDGCVQFDSKISGDVQCEQKVHYPTNYNLFIL